MDTRAEVTVAMFGLLHTLRRERGLSVTERLSVPDDGTTARLLAEQLELPLERIDGVFRNHVPAGLDCSVAAGDRVAFVPIGTPASHPAFFGPFGGTGAS